MPTYYFHLRNGEDVLLDPEGRELDIMSSVELATLVQARGLISQDALDGRIDLAYHLDVEDEAGLVVHSLPFTDAVEIAAGGAMHALIIEDEGLIALQIEDILSEIGYKSFDHAPSVDDALDAARDRCPDLITADHRIIGGTGAQAVREICSEKTIPVLFITGSDTEVRKQIPQALIVNKPFSTSTLCKLVEEAILPLGRFTT